MKSTDIVEIYLTGIRVHPPGGKFSFLAREDAAFSGGFGYDFFIDDDCLRPAVIALAREFPIDFSRRPYEHIRSLLLDFLSKRLIFEIDENLEIFLKQESGQTLSDYVDPGSYAAIWDRLVTFIREKRQPNLHLAVAHNLRPCVSVEDLDLVLIGCRSDLSATLKKFGLRYLHVQTDRFPPIQDHRLSAPLSETDSWVGCITNRREFESDRIQNIAGAVFVSLDINESRMFNMVEARRGNVTFSSEGTCTFSRGDPLLPSIYDPQILNQRQIDFLRQALIAKRGDQRLQTALEFTYHGWKPRGRIGFLNFAIAFDALFGETGKVGKSIKEGIVKCAPQVSQIDEKAHLLYRMRNTLLHGGHPSLDACGDYLDYFERFGKDPEVEQFEILRSCIWSVAHQN